MSQPTQDRSAVPIVVGESSDMEANDGSNCGEGSSFPQRAQQLNPLRAKFAHMAAHITLPSAAVGSANDSGVRVHVAQNAVVLYQQPRELMSVVVARESVLNVRVTATQRLQAQALAQLIFSSTDVELTPYEIINRQSFVPGSAYLRRHDYLGATAPVLEHDALVGTTKATAACPANVTAALAMVERVFVGDPSTEQKSLGLMRLTDVLLQVVQLEHLIKRPVATRAHILQALHMAVLSYSDAVMWQGSSLGWARSATALRSMRLATMYLVIAIHRAMVHQLARWNMPLLIQVEPAILLLGGVANIGST